MERIVSRLSRAQSEVERLELAVARWQTEAEAKRQELVDLEAGAGEAVLADETGSAARELAVTSMELRFSVDGARAAAQAAQTKLRGARWELELARAAEKREEAAGLRSVAEQRQAKIDELVAAVVEFEGGDWRPWEPTQEQVIQAGAAGVPLSPRRTPPMLARAAELDRQAQTLEERVAAEQRQAAPVEPHARIVWPGKHYKGQLVNLAAEAGVNEGVGSVRFEVLRNGQVVHERTLPDGDRRGFRKSIDGFHGDTIEVLADGKLIASETPKAPDGEVNDGRGHPVVAGHFS